MTRFRKGYSLVLADGAALEREIEEIASAGFEGIEPTFVAGAWPSPEEHLKRARTVRSICERAGLEVLGMRGGRVPWDTIPNPDPGQRAAALDHTQRALEATAEMGGTVLLVVPGDRTPDVSYHDHWARVVEYGHRAAELCRTIGVNIGFENVEARFPASERDWTDLVDEIDEPEIGAYFDVGNVLWLGFGYPEHWIRTLHHRICRVHFKDATYRLAGATLHAEIRHLLEGDVNWQSVMSALHEIDYRGWISVEPTAYKQATFRLPERLSRDLDAIFDLARERVRDE